jgi:cell division protein ZapA
MAQVTVTINGHPYAVACSPGEEHRIRDLARLLETKVAGFVGQSQRAGEARLLVLAALVLADELTEANDTVRRLSAGAGVGGDDPALADGIDRLARRIEAVAQQVEAAQI